MNTITARVPKTTPLQEISILEYSWMLDEMEKDELEWVAEEHAKGSEHHMWYVCLSASEIVGRYEKGGTKELAGRIGKDVSMVENYAKAGRLYRDLEDNVLDPDSLRKDLTIKHFYVAETARRKWDIPLEDIAYDMEYAVTIGASANHLGDYLAGEYGQPDPQWMKRRDSLRKAAEKLSDDYGVPTPLRWLARAIVKRLDQIGG